MDRTTTSTVMKILVFLIKIESRLWENDKIYFDKGDYDKDPAAYNSGRRKRVYQYAVFVLWEGINYRKPPYRCIEDGVQYATF
jgi:hypothetical protein